MYKGGVGYHPLEMLYIGFSPHEIDSDTFQDKHHTLTVNNLHCFYNLSSAINIST